MEKRVMRAVEGVVAGGSVRLSAHYPPCQLGSGIKREDERSPLFPFRTSLAECSNRLDPSLRLNCFLGLVNWIIDGWRLLRGPSTRQFFSL